MSGDPEIQAMSTVSEALSDLDDEAVRRVLRWAVEKYGTEVNLSGGGGGRGNEDKEARDSRYGSDDEDYLDTFAEFFHAASPETEAEKALLAGYWFQEEEGKSELTSRMINDELKQLGYPIANITREVGRLMNKKPALMVQLRKTGSSQQAHKIYKLTHAGKKQVERMLSERQG